MVPLNCSRKKKCFQVISNRGYTHYILGGVEMRKEWWGIFSCFFFHFYIFIIFFLHFLFLSFSLSCYFLKISFEVFKTNFWFLRFCFFFHLVLIKKFLVRWKYRALLSEDFSYYFINCLIPLRLYYIYLQPLVHMYLSPVEYSYLKSIPYLFENSIHLHITPIPNFELRNTAKEFSWRLFTNFIKFITAKFNLNLAFVQILSIFIDKN